MAGMDHRLGTFVFLCAFVGTGLAQAASAPPYKNPSLPPEKRVEDLLKRMTLEEKLNQLRCDIRESVWLKALKTTGFGQTYDILRPLTASEAAKRANEVMSLGKQNRLGIPIIIHDEALHGLIANGTTSFPQSIAMAATWDPDLVGRVSAAIAKETRARGVRHVLSPVVNVIRDPRWGRTEETYGEDPLLCSRMGTAFVKAFEAQGVITTPKHYIVNAWDGGRDSHSVQISERSLREIYLPPFKAAIQEGGARSIMSSYNSVNGVAASANQWLLTQILRKELGFKGFVVSDYGAVGDVQWAHRNAATDAETAAACLNAGLEMEWPDVNIWGRGLEEAVAKRLVSKKTLDEAVRRVLLPKFQLGLFEFPMLDVEAADKIVQCQDHRDLALEAARKAIVLLQNKSNALPFSKALKSVAVIGQDAKDRMPLGGYSGWNQPTVSVLQGVREKLGPGVKVEWARGASYGERGGMPSVPTDALRTLDGKPGLKADFFKGTNLEGNPVLSRVDSLLDFDWGNGAPDGQVPDNRFSVRWTGVLVPPKTGKYTIAVTADDGARVFLAGRRIIDDWSEHAARTSVAEVNLTAAEAVPITVEYMEMAGQASITLGWRLPDQDSPLIAEAVALAEQSDAVVVVAGILEGEGRDRARLDLPGDQEDMIRAVAAVGKPVAVVLIAGAPVTMERWADHVDAILCAWYPGQEGGTAIADVLFGDVNPSGKLPITFPLNVGQVPTYYNMEPSGRGYDYVDLTGKPKFSFGYGLSYTSFKYSNLRLSSKKINRKQSVTVAFDVANTGPVAGDEVAQLYIRDVVASIVRPLKELRDFARISLKPGEKKTVSFTLKPEQLALLGADMKPVVEPGTFEIYVGSSSEDNRLRGSFEVTAK